MIYKIQDNCVPTFIGRSLMKLIIFSIFLVSAVAIKATAQRYDGVRMTGTKAKRTKGVRERGPAEWTISLGPSYSRGINMDSRPIKPWGMNNDYLNYLLNGQLMAQRFGQRWGLQFHVLLQSFHPGPAYSDRRLYSEGGWLDVASVGVGLNYSWYNDGSIRAYSGLKVGSSYAHEYSALVDNTYYLPDYSATLLGLHIELQQRWGLVGEISYGTLGLLYLGLSYRL